MNQRTSYEILISQKAEQCTAPDMADSIWSSIEAGLPASPGNINTNDGQLNSAEQTGKLLNWGKLSLFIAAGIITIVAIILLSLPDKSSIKDNKNNNPVQPEYQPAPVQPSKDSLHQAPVEIKKATPTYSPPGKNTTVDRPDSTTIKKDTVTNTPPINSPRVDSVAAPPQKRPDSTVAAPGNKKPRGVQGISPDDYKIIPIQKDSTNGRQ